jgi:Tol biopolymer transport system component
MFAMTITSGTRLGHYTIVSPLGAGGMGEVWLAEDATLKRKVALKVLPAAVAGDPDRLARFQREAETIAALSHPNIVTIHSIEQDGDVRFLTMELVEGQSLDRMIPRGGLPLGQVLDIGAALADALVASHDKGIIHRDLKPANVMLTKERRVKVLDFGLAKLREEATFDGETRTAAITGEGRIVGTVAYMSPEQAEGKPVDARSDLFSLGIVLYELATGERPFKGETSLSVLSAILRETPKSVSELRAELPRELSRIVRQCLQKDPEERYQTAKDVRNQLRALKADVDSGEIAPASAPAQVPVRRRSWNAWVAVGGGAIVLFVLAALIATRLGLVSETPAGRPFESIRLKQLTDIGNVVGAAISPDGRYVAYSTREGDHDSLWLRQVSTSSDVRVVPPQTDRYDAGMAFSSDGSFIYYLAVRRGQDMTGRLCRVTSLGGTPQQVIEGGDVIGFAVAADGRRMAFVRLSDGREASAHIAGSDGTGERVIARRKLNDWTGLSDLLGFRVAWSPDGRSLATTFGDHILLLDPETGAQRDVGKSPVGFGALESQNLAWLPDANSFLVAGRDPNAAEATQQIYVVTLPGLDARAVTRDLSTYRSLSVTADLRAAAALQESFAANVWVLAVDDVQGARPITSRSKGAEGSLGMVWTRDDRLVFTSSSRRGLWSMNADGSGRRQLSFAEDFGPAVSPDGRSIAFLRVSPGGGGDAWRMDADGGSPRQLTHMGNVVAHVSYTSDGAWVTFFDREAHPWRIPADGGEPVRLFAKEGAPGSPAVRAVPAGFFGLAISPDGRWLAGSYKDSADGQYWLAVVSTDGSQSWRKVPSPPHKLPPARVGWTPDGRALSYVSSAGGSANIWLQPIEGGPPRQLTRFAGEDIGRYAWSHDGRRLAVSCGKTTTDVVLITSDEKK